MHALRLSRALAALALFVAALLGTALTPSRALAGTEVKQSAKGMTYSLRVPGGYDPSEGALLALCLHGQGGSHTQLLRAVEPQGFLSKAILVVPNATSNAAWEESDIDLVADLVREVRERFRVHRSVAFGYSRGAFLSFGLGLLRPDAVEGVIAHSGGLVVPVPDTEKARAQVFAVIHGDADAVVPVTQSREAVKALEAGRITSVKYDELPGVPHTVDMKAVERALGWIESTLDARAAERVKALEAAVKAKDAPGITAALDALGPVGKALHGKAVGLAAKHLGGSDDDAAVAAAGALSRLGGDPATAQLLKALPGAESKKRTDVVEAINEALKALTGQTFTTSKEWKKWASGRKA